MPRKHVVDNREHTQYTDNGRRSCRIQMTKEIYIVYARVFRPKNNKTIINTNNAKRKSP